jgi:hypothetical protein
VSLHQRNSQIWSDLIASSVQENFCLVFSIASSVTKILANKIVSLYSIFFSKIWYLYRFKRYIFEYRCPPLGRKAVRDPEEGAVPFLPSAP